MKSKHLSLAILVLTIVGIIFISGCIQQVEKECETGSDCPTKTCFTPQCTDNKCVYSSIDNCCGNGRCEVGETYLECAADCPDCDDEDDCTADSYDYQGQECVNEVITPCCGNGECETGETYEECAGDCVKSGALNEDEVWGGTIHVTGDIDVNPDVTLTILPGTIIKVALSDDQHKGSDIPITDTNFPNDPPFYEKEKITITIHGALNAVGTPDNRIVFTSASDNPTTYDWRGIDIFHGRLEYTIVEYGQGTIQLQHSSDVVLSNNIIRNSLSCCICIGHSNQISPDILNNDVYNCGHECIDYAGGSALIKGNHFHVENPEIQPDTSRGRVGIVVYRNTYPTIEDNIFEKHSTGILFLDNSFYEEEPGNHVMLRSNTMTNNNIDIDIDPGYPANVILTEIMENS